MRIAHAGNIVCRTARVMGLFAIVAIGTTANAQMVRFLPAAGFNTGASLNNQYGANLTNFNQQVIVNGQSFGTISFDYNTYGGAPVGNPAGFTGGGALAGTFTAAGDARLVPGSTIGWCQIVNATISGTNVWGAANGTWFPDTANQASPIYPFQSLPGGAVAAQPSANFQDFPNRFPNAGNQSWNAELALVCLNNTTHVADVIESFTWGFGVTNANPGTIANITPTAPAAWGAPSANFLATEQASFNTTNFAGATNWTFAANASNFLTPEPGGTAMLAAGLLSLTGFAIKRRRKAA